MGKQRSTQSQGFGNTGAKTAIDVELVEEAHRAIERSLREEEAWSRQIAEAVDHTLESGALAPSEQRALRGLASARRRGVQRIGELRRKAQSLKRRP